MILCWPRPTWQKNQHIADSYASVVVQPCHKHVIPQLSFNSVDHSLAEWWKGRDPRAFATPSRRILYAHGRHISMKDSLFQKEVFLKNSSTSIKLEAVSKSDNIRRGQAKTWRSWLLITNPRCQSKIRIRKQTVFWLKKKHRKIIKQIWMAKHPHSWIFCIVSAIATEYTCKLEKHLFTSWPFSL